MSDTTELTTDEVRNAFVQTSVWLPRTPFAMYGEVFDRWKAENDRQVAAKALEEAALALITDETAQAGTTKAAYNAIYATWLVQRAAEYRSTVKGEGN